MISTDCALFVKLRKVRLNTQDGQSSRFACHCPGFSRASLTSQDTAQPWANQHSCSSNATNTISRLGPTEAGLHSYSTQHPAHLPGLLLPHMRFSAYIMYGRTDKGIKRPFCA